MMKKKKLTLNKEIIASLSNEEMKYVKGGDDVTRGCADTKSDLQTADPMMICCKDTKTGNNSETCNMCTWNCTWMC